MFICDKCGMCCKNLDKNALYSDLDRGDGVCYYLTTPVTLAPNGGWAIGKQGSYAMLINALIAMIHFLFCDSDDKMERKLFEVRTRKILSYSNFVASSTNLAVVAVTKDMKMLDLGGLAVTVYRLITDKKFIRDVKEEFIFGSFKKAIQGDKLVLL